MFLLSRDSSPNCMHRTCIVSAGLNWVPSGYAITSSPIANEGATTLRVVSPCMIEQVAIMRVVLIAPVEAV